MSYNFDAAVPYADAIGQKIEDDNPNASNFILSGFARSSKSTELAEKFSYDAKIVPLDEEGSRMNDNDYPVSVRTSEGFGADSQTLLAGVARVLEDTDDVYHSEPAMSVQIMDETPYKVLDRVEDEGVQVHATVKRRVEPSLRENVEERVAISPNSEIQYQWARTPLDDSLPQIQPSESEMQDRGEELQTALSQAQSRVNSLSEAEISDSIEQFEIKYY